MKIEHYNPKNDDVIVTYSIVHDIEKLFKDERLKPKIFDIDKKSFSVAISSHYFRSKTDIINWVLEHDRNGIIDVNIPKQRKEKINKAFKKRLVIGVDIKGVLDERAYELWINGIDLLIVKNNHKTVKAYLKDFEKLTEQRNRLRKPKKKYFAINYDKRIAKFLRNIRHRHVIANRLDDIIDAKQDKFIVISDEFLPGHKLSPTVKKKISEMLGVDVIGVGMDEKIRTKALPMIQGDIYPQTIRKLRKSYRKICLNLDKAIWDHPDGHVSASKAVSIAINKPHRAIISPEYQKAIHKWG